MKCNTVQYKIMQKSTISQIIIENDVIHIRWSDDVTCTSLLKTVIIITLQEASNLPFIS